jgi:membrane protein
MATWVERMKQRPWLAHLLRAFEHFNLRLGIQLGAAVTYYSVLAVVPVLMLGFSITGFVLTIVRPDLVEPLASAIADTLGSADPAAKDNIKALIERALGSYTAIGIVGLATALYSGAGWMGTLRDAIRAQWRQDFDLRFVYRNIVVKTVVNLVTLVGVIVAVAVTFGLASLSTALADVVIAWLGLDSVGWLEPVLRIVPVAFSIGAGWLTFMYLYTVLPETRAPWRIVRRGALIGAVALAAIQYLASFLIVLFSRSLSALLFGPVIALMIFFNLFARLILLIAAWIATAPEPRVDPVEDEDSAPLPQPPERSENHASAAMVSEKVATKSVRAGMRAGYITGAATGAGVGAALAFLLSLFRGRGTSRDKSG